MNIVKAKKKYFTEKLSGNSVAYQLHPRHSLVHVLPTLGSCKFFYTLATAEEVINDSAIWHESKAVGDIKDDSIGIPIQTAVSFVRFEADNSASYILEIAGGRGLF